MDISIWNLSNLPGSDDDIDRRSFNNVVHWRVVIDDADVVVVKMQLKILLVV